MDRTVPNSGNEEISLYIRTYYSLLRSSREVQIASVIEAHLRTRSALHVNANQPVPDMAAFIYAVLRLPDCFTEHVRLVVMGQSDWVFATNGYPQVEHWQVVAAPARRRRSFWDGGKTLAVYIASQSDIDDLIPMLAAYQIEREKMFHLLNRPLILQALQEAADDPHNPALLHQALTRITELAAISAEDLDKLRTIWRGQTAVRLLAIAEQKCSLAVRLLAGSFADYKRATRRWWDHISRSLPDILFSDRPIYFISSNIHSLPNLLSGYARQIDEELVRFIEEEGDGALQQEYADIVKHNVPSNRENLLYYVLKKYEGRYPQATAERENREKALGIHRIPSEHVFDVEAQVVELNKLRPDLLDPRLQIKGAEKLSESQALIVNIDYPLGMAAYQILSEVARNIAQVRGVYIMGKAATLNGRVGDVMIPSVVHDEHSQNTYLFGNRFTADHVVPYLVYGTVLDNQKAITAPGTFLQNHEYMSVFYQEGYTDMEMEAGPYLSCVYEMIRPRRYPQNELVNLYQSPFPIGILHYASDTPFSKGKNLGAQNLSYFGMDPTYATMIAILRAILEDEAK
ncbi:MAG: hypothetical protein IPL28_24600 [Chloroflexi bacterium]|nr:hypothetical protein [Chloroflexota bacterium]MDA0244304.1 hypothetical protein [Chloroflexota bacterium]